MPRTEQSAQRRSIPNKPKQTINNGGRCVAIDVHGFANLHRHPNTANQTCSCLAAISNMAVQSFCRLLVHSNPTPSPWRKRFFLLAKQCFGATYEPLFLVRSWCFGCRKTKNRFETRLWLWTSTGTALVEKRLLWSVWVLTPQYSDGDTILSKEHRLSDDTLNRGPDSLWSLKIPWHSS